MRKIICFLMLSILLVIFCACVNNNQEIEPNDTDQTEEYETAGSVFPGGIFATYEKFDRELSLNDFYDLERGMAYQTIIERFGEINGKAGSYFMYPYYELSDETYLMLDLNIDDKLNGLILVDQKGRRYFWFPDDIEE